MVYSKYASENVLQCNSIVYSKLYLCPIETLISLFLLYVLVDVEQILSSKAAGNEAVAGWKTNQIKDYITLRRA